jgi:hypothetical protein
MPMRKDIGYAAMKLGYWKLKLTAGIGNTKNRPKWLA